MIFGVHVSYSSTPERLDLSTLCFCSKEVSGAREVHRLPSAGSRLGINCKDEEKKYMY